MYRITIDEPPPAPIELFPATEAEPADLATAIDGARRGEIVRRIGNAIRERKDELGMRFGLYVGATTSGGSFWSPSNHQPQCRSCHAIKTQAGF